jgi:hypothetical protein
MDTSNIEELYVATYGTITLTLARMGNCYIIYERDTTRPDMHPDLRHAEDADIPGAQSHAEYIFSQLLPPGMIKEEE